MLLAALVAALGRLTATGLLVILLGAVLLGVARIWREHRKRLGQAKTTPPQAETTPSQVLPLAVSLSRSLARFSALFILPPVVAVLGFMVLYMYALLNSGSWSVLSGHDERY